jgi:hypothetical protein
VEVVNIRKEPQMRDRAPSQVTFEGPEPQRGIWPEVAVPTLKSERIVYPGAGSELFHGKKKV